MTDKTIPERLLDLAEELAEGYPDRAVTLREVAKAHERDSLPPEPPMGSVVLDCLARPWKRVPDGWYTGGGSSWTWEDLNRHNGPLTMIYDPAKPLRTYDPETECVVRVRDLPGPFADGLRAASENYTRHGQGYEAKTVLALANALERRERERGEAR